MLYLLNVLFCYYYYYYYHHTDNFVYGCHHFMWFLRFVYIKPGLMFIQFYISFFCFPWVGYQVLRPLTLRSFEGHLFYYFGRLSRFTIEGYSEKPILLRRVAIHARSYIRIKSSCSILHKDKVFCSFLTQRIESFIYLLLPCLRWHNSFIC